MKYWWDNDNGRNDKVYQFTSCWGAVCPKIIITIRLIFIVRMEIVLRRCHRNTLLNFRHSDESTCTQHCLMWQWGHMSAMDFQSTHYSDVIMGAMAFQITSLTIVYSIVYSGTKANNAENVSIWWRHHASNLIVCLRKENTNPLHGVSNHQQLDCLFTKLNMKTVHYCLFVRKFIGDRRNSLTRDQYCEKHSNAIIS